MTRANAYATSNHYELLDGLRGVAAIAVLFAHACSVMSPEHNPILWRKYLAVYFFFMLSGFVIASAYERRIQAGYNLKKFAALRAIRLYPMIFVGTLIATIAALVFDPTILRAPSIASLVVFSLACWPYPESGFGSGLFPINPPAWSLFFELVAYSIFALAVPKLKTKAVFGIVIICFSCWYAVIFNFKDTDPPFWTLSFGALGAFLLGNLLWRFHESNPESVLKLPFYVLAGMLVAICSLPKSLSLAADVAIVAAILPGIILSGATRTMNSSKMMKFLGDISYPLYILHWGVLQITLHTIRPRFGYSFAVAAGMTASIFLAWILMFYFDAPLRKILNRRAQKISSSNVSIK